MENTKISPIDEDILYCSTRSSYGVCSKNIKSQKNIYMSFSPFSSNQKISFSNTIMIPFIKAETLKEETTNISIEKPITKILIENETDKIDENTNDEIYLKIVDNKDQKYTTEKNPFYLGGKISLDIAKFQSGNLEIEKKKGKKISNMKQFKTINEDVNLHLKTSKDMSKKLNIENNKIKSKNKMRRTNSINVNRKRDKIFLEKEESEKKIRRSVFKYKTDFSSEIKNKMDQNYKSIYKPRNSDKNLVFKNNKIKGSKFKREKEREKTVVMLIKENNIKAYKASLFNKNSSKKLKIKEEINLNKKDKNSKYKGISHNSLQTNFNFETKEEKKARKEKKENFIKALNKKSNLNFINSAKVKKYKSLTKEFIAGEKKKIQNIMFKKKISETKRNLDFESALKNKNNLAKTQFNLFSPDKFTNTQFCGSDYLEYTLDCMELILQSNKSQKQVKSKVNFNFPKTKGNKLKKKIALFDLDETLVHCTGDINLKKEEYQHIIEIVLPGNKRTKVGINIRPLWKKTLNLIRKHYYIVVFTASHQAYADAVLNFMDPSNKYFKYRLYRNNCSLVDIEGAKFYVKDLDIFDEFYNLKDILIIDNSVLSFIYHLENGIPIVPYYHEDKDGSLYVVGLYLLHIFKEEDLREANKKYINLESFLNEVKLRKESDSIINEESNNDIKKDINDNNNNKNVNNMGHLTDPRRCSFSIENTQNTLKINSKLLNMYYEINNNKYLTDKKSDEIIEEKSNKSFSIDEEKEINQNKKYKNISELFYERRLLTTEEKPIRNNSFKNNKTIHHYLNTKMICSNFYNKFSDKNLKMKK